MGLTQQLRHLWERAFPVKVEMPSRVLESSAPGIRDGLDYAQPILLPGHQRQQLEASGHLQEWLADQSDVPTRYRGQDTFAPAYEDPLREWNWTTRQQVLSTCHSAYQRNPIAKRATHYVSAFVVGEGFNLTCQNKDVEEVLQAFIDNPDNAIREYERQAVIDLLLDGELFLRLFEEGGEIVAVPQRPWEVQYIHTEPGFFRRPLTYHMQPYTTYNSDDPQGSPLVVPYDVPAKAMMHVAINRHAYELRGRPELYAALPWLRAHKEFLENRARQNHWRGALLWWVKIASQVPSVIAAKLAQYQKPPTPGSTVVTSDKEEWTALTNPVGAGDASEDGRQMKIMALNGIAGIPEYMTGDGENANLATTTSQQLPVLKTFGEFQTIMVEQVWLPLFKRVIQAKIDRGELPEEVEEQDADGEPVEQSDSEVEASQKAKSTTAQEAFPPTPAGKPMQVAVQMPTPTPHPPNPTRMLKTIDAFDVSYEPVGDQDPYTLAQALQIHSTEGWASQQTVSTKAGYDYALEQKRIQRERQKTNDAIARGEMPAPPGLIPPGMDDPNAQGQAAQTTEGLETDEQRRWWFAHLATVTPPASGGGEKPADAKPLPSAEPPKAPVNPFAHDASHADRIAGLERYAQRLEWRSQGDDRGVMFEQDRQNMDDNISRLRDRMEAAGNITNAEGRQLRAIGNNISGNLGKLEDERRHLGVQAAALRTWIARNR